MNRLQLVMTLSLAAGLLPLASVAETRGVSKSEIVVGSIQDLSGPIASIGTHFRNADALR
jgi:branched-chain amino acid transport system substrate-binding protein